MALRRNPSFKQRPALYGAALCLATASCSGAWEHSARADSPAATLETSALQDDRLVVHALNRLSFGPRLEDVERVRKMGVNAWIDEQLSPDEIEDDDVEKKLKTFQHTTMAPWRLMSLYEFDNRQPRRDDALLLKPADLLTPANFLDQLADARVALSAFLLKQFSAQARERLLNRPKATASEGLQQSVVYELNQILRDESLYQRFARANAAANAVKGGFAHVTLSKAAEALRLKNPQGDELVRLNRMLLEEAYPRQIAKIPAKPDGEATAMTGNADILGDPQIEMLKNDGRMMQVAEDKMEFKIQSVQRGLSQRAVDELIQDKLIRAVESNRQLQEVLVDFWSNHFSMDVRKGPVRVLKVIDEREVIRPHVLGKFRDLLGASAKSPAMLQYLDNVLSTSEFEMPANQPTVGKALPKKITEDEPTPEAVFMSGVIEAAVEAPQAMETAPEVPAEPAIMAPAMTPMMMTASRRRIGGLNENYARELMELHTLGADGGYTQKDVQEVARCFTAWSCSGAGKFVFNPTAHDAGEKTVLGHSIPAGGGIRDGEMVLDILASHPSTARFIARKLCVRLVSDEPPAALVEKIAKVFLDTDGDLRQVVKAIALSPEFRSTAAYRSKIKSPFEYAVSAVRAVGKPIRLGSGGRPQIAGRPRQGLSQYIAAMGQPLFSHLTPDGFPEDSREWLSAGALIARLNFAVGLCHDQVAETQVSSALLGYAEPTDHEAALNALSIRVLGGEMSPGMKAALSRQLPKDAAVDPIRITTIMLGAPEFQRR